MTRTRFLALILPALVGASLTVYPQAKRIVSPPGSAIAGLPYSPGARSGDLLFVAGQVATDSGGSLVAGGIREQTRQTIENVRAVLEADGLSLDNVVQTKVYLSDSRLFGEMNEEYRKFFQTAPPTRATVEADIALPGSLIEIQAIAVRSGLRKEVVSLPGEAPNTRPYSRAIRAGDYVFLAGLISQDLQTGERVDGDVGAQTRRVLDNARDLAEAAGFSMDDMTVSNVFLTDGRDFSGMNEVYRAYFGEIPPTRATVRARLMSPDSKVEIMLWGMRGERERLGGGSSPILSPGIRIGNLVFLSGFVRATPELRGDVRGQTRAVLEQARSVLAEADMDLGDAVNSSVFLTDVRTFGEMNEVYREMVAPSPPPRATVGTALMSAAGLVEIMLIAAK